MDGYNGASGSIQLNLATAPPVPLVINTSPQPQVDIPGANVSFSSAATGSPPVHYQWRKNGANISGATSATLTLSGVTTNDVASYLVVATNEIGSTNSGIATLVLTNGATINTLAGSPGFGSTDGPGTSARFHYPDDVATDAAGNVYVADGQNNTIRKVTPAGVVSTLAGLAGSAGYADGTGANARFWNPAGIVVDAATNVYVSDAGNNLLRRITPNGTVTTVAGKAGGGAYADGTGGAAQFNGPSGLGVDGAGNVFMADAFNNLIRRITPAGVVSTVAGIPGVIGSADGPGTNATFYYPEGVDVDASNNLYVADTFNNEIRKITPAGVVSTYAGSSRSLGSKDGAATNALFYEPQGLEADAAGNVYVADTLNHTLRRITPAGVVSTLAGLAGVAGSIDGTNGSARFNGPTGVAVDSAGDIFVADAMNNTIRKVTANGTATTLAGISGSGTNDGPAPPPGSTTPPGPPWTARAMCIWPTV